MPKGIYVLTKEWKRKISESCKGRIPWNKNKKNIYSKETLQKISKSVSIVQKKLCQNPKYIKRKSEAAKKLWQNSEFKEKRIKAQSGKNSHFWKGGISFEEYPVEFDNILKEFIRNRDGRICQLCNKTEKENNKKLSAHHIDYNKKNCKKENLVSLCINCNFKVNFNRSFWINYFKNLI